MVETVVFLYYNVSLLYNTCDEIVAIYFVVVTSEVILLIFCSSNSFFRLVLGNAISTCGSELNEQVKQCAICAMQCVDIASSMGI